MRIDVYFDVLCPWSSIAKRRLESALSALPDADRAEVVWRSFELSPGNRRTQGPTAAEAMTEWWGERTADRMLEHLLSAYHTDGLNVADPRVLESLGTKAGLDIDDVGALLVGDAYADAVRADEERAVERGVTGVPALVIGTRPPVSAVQPPEELSRLLERGMTGPPGVPARPTRPG